MAPPPTGKAGPGSNLATRIFVAVPLIAVALGAIWLGGWFLSALVCAGVMLILWEWGAMNGVEPRARVGGLLLLVGVCWLAATGEPGEALGLLAAGAALIFLLLAMTQRPDGHWLLSGLAYAGLPAVALIWLRLQPDGFPLVMWTMGVVWATDIFAYFAGRTVGGPKIWPAVSPNKTWAGLIGGMKAAAIFSGIFAWAIGWPMHPLLYALAGAGLAVLAQAGDFLESWLKRRAGVKDSGSLLPGHGGIMDRVDGLVPVSVAVALWAALSHGMMP